jgi:FkbM family methyltransferase
VRARDSKAGVMRHDDLIYDVGMHKGEDTRYYLRKGFRVVAFEANPVLVSECRARFASEVQSGRLSIVGGAIVPAACREDSITFFVNERKSVFGTIDAEFVQRNLRSGMRCHEVTVPAVRFVECLQRHGVPYYLKIDIEGADRECVSALREFADRPTYVSLESSKRSLDEVAAEVTLLSELGYDRFAAIQQMRTPWHTDTIERDDGSRESFRFRFGSSGPFGEGLGVEWNTKQEVMERYDLIFKKYRRWGDDTIWQRNTALKAVTRAFHLATGIALPGWYDTHARHSTAS